MTRRIETSRLTLRPWEDTDVGDVVRIFTAPPVARWILPRRAAFGKPPALRTALAQWCDQDPTGSASEGHWTVQEPDTNDIVGRVSLQYTPTGGESLTIDWVLDTAAWGRGYAAEAEGGLIRWAMHEREVLEVFADLDPENLLVAATAEGIGMEWVTEVGHLPRGRFQVYRVRHGDPDFED